MLKHVETPYVYVLIVLNACVIIGYDWVCVQVSSEIIDIAIYLEQFLHFQTNPAKYIQIPCC